MMLPDQQHGIRQLFAALCALSIFGAIAGMGMTRVGNDKKRERQYLYTRDLSLHLTIGSIRKPHVTTSAQNSHPSTCSAKQQVSL